MEKIKKLQEILSKIDEVETVLKELKKIKTEAESEIVRESIETGIECRGIKTGYKNIFTICGGEKQSPQRQELFEIINDLGMGEKIVEYRNMRKDDLEKTLEQLPPETLQKIIEKKLVSVFQLPFVKFTGRKSKQES